MNSFYSKEELASIGFKGYGANVLISKKASFYSPASIILGNNVRIDDFAILSGNITIGDNVHISAYVALYGFAGIEIEDYAGISAQTTVYSEIDDFSGKTPVGPWHKKELRNVTSGKIVIRKYAQIGCNSVIFPGVIIGEGAVIGALSLVKSSLDPWTINAGIPVKFIKNRSKDMLTLIES